MLVLVNSNAENWLQMNLQILEDHYGKTIQDPKACLSQFVGQDYHQPWEVANRWLKKFPHTPRSTIEGAEGELRQIGMNVGQRGGGPGEGPSTQTNLGGVREEQNAKAAQPIRG
ncbi:hypothetical protein VZT92_008422 [Zoarces viviparus]|uniref:Mos1 transposase HTH domain-containing protein n=1 Tax=Zoarces viviparus TaxID=48416 RepID=A0AAW1FEK0_ZOAVI